MWSPKKICDSTIHSDNLGSREEGHFFPASWNCQKKDPGNSVVQADIL